MKLRMASIGFLLLGTCNAKAGSTEGASYVHRVEKSRFNVGAGAHVEVEGPYERVVGDKKAFLVDTVTGATLAVPNSSALEVSKETPLSEYPQPLTKNPDEHSAKVLEYLVAAGAPANQIGGTHVTTTMAGGGPMTDGVQPSRSRLLFYTTHLERKVGGIPVEGSYAYAALDSAGQVITEGMYWPAIPASVVSEAQALKARLASTNELVAFKERVKAARKDVGNAAGEVKIVHTSAGYHGPLEAKAVYTVIARSAAGGKAQIARFDDAGTPVLMADEQRAADAKNSVKQQ